MPTRNYMVIDARHDHSIRIPRPDLSVDIGTPNACNNCHDDKSAEWSSKKVNAWYGHDAKGFQSYAIPLDDARQGKQGAGSRLADLVRNKQTPDIARATAIANIGLYMDLKTADVIDIGLTDANPVVRTEAVKLLEGLPEQYRALLAFPMLKDPVRSVRIEAARALSTIPGGKLAKRQQTMFDKGLREYIEAQLSNAERPEAQTNLAGMYASLGELDKAVTAYNTAIELNPAFIPAYIHLSDFYRVQKDEVKAEKTLREALQVTPDSADAHFSLGLSLIRQQKNAEAVDALQRASDFDSSNAHYVYVYAIALNSTGKKTQALEVLQTATVLFPQDTNILNALVTFHRDAGNEFAAQTFMKKIQKLK